MTKTFHFFKWFILFVVALLLCIIPAETYGKNSFQCFIEIAKSNCYSDRQVTIMMFDAAKDKQVNSFTLDKKTQYLKKQFDCTNLNLLSFKATFSPPIWSNNAGKKYKAERYWQIPTNLAKGKTKWIAQLCFANSFSGVALPTGSITSCACQFPQDQNQ